MDKPPLTFDREASRAVDRAAIEEYGVQGIVLMENAARALASCAMEMLLAIGSRQSAIDPEHEDPLPLSAIGSRQSAIDPEHEDPLPLSAIGSRQSAIDSEQDGPLPIAHCPLPLSPNDVLIICGSGNNGGDGYAAARHLHNAGCDVTICAVGEPRPGSDAAVNRLICQRMGLQEIGPEGLTAGHGGPAPPMDGPALLVDALFGTGLDRPVEGEAARIIAWMNEARARGSLIVAADIPSGLDCDTGRELGVAVRANRTVSFLGWKKGFLIPGAGAREYTGEVVVGDIGAPVELLERFSIKREPGRRT